MINDKKTIIGNRASALFCVPQRYEGQEDEEEGVSIYWMTLGKREGTGNWNREHWIALCGEMAVEGTVVRQTVE
jgi:hypothetical protein